MAQETQKPIENKEFDFILNQTPEDQPIKKGPDKKIIAIIALVILTLLVMGVSFIVGSNNNVQKNNSNNSTSADQTKSKDVVESFLKNMNEKKYDDAYALFSDTSVVSRDEFDTKSIPYLENLDLTTCVVQEQQDDLVDNNGNVIRSYVCKTKNLGNSIGLQFSIKSSDSANLSINAYYIVSAS